MITVHIFSKVKRILLATLTLVSISATATEVGTNSGGGGHVIEALVKAKILSLVSEATQMSPEQKRILLFNPLEVLAIIKQPPEGFKPLCATGDTLSNLRSERKMARVYAENLMTIHLNCTDYGVDVWRRLTQSNEDSDDMFFVHEALRVANIEREDGWAISASFIEARMAHPDYKVNKLRKAMISLVSLRTNPPRDSSGPRCYIQFKFNRHGSYSSSTDILLLINGTVVFSEAFHRSIETVSTWIQSLPTHGYESTNERLLRTAEAIYSLARLNGCAF